MRVNYLTFRSNKIPSSSYIISDRLTIIPVQKMVNETITSELMIGNVYSIDQNFLMNFGIYHAFITGEIEILRNTDELLKSVVTKNYKQIEDFIKEQEAFIMRQDANYPDYEKITPIHKLPLEMSYKEGYLRFMEAKANELKIYEQIQLYVFALGFSSWQSFYDNLNLKDSLNYTILDSIVGQPSWCKTKAYCDSCSNEVQHRVKSLTSFSKEQLAPFLSQLDSEDVNLYIKLIGKIIQKRGETYHNAGYYNVLRELIHEMRNIEPKFEKWTLEHTIKNFDKTPMARQVASLRFSNLVKFILINKLLSGDNDEE